MIGPTMIETPQDIQSRPPSRTEAKSGPEDKSDQRAFDDLLDSTEESGTASDQAPAARESRNDRRAETGAESGKDEAKGDGGSSAETKERPRGQATESKVMAAGRTQVAAFGSVLAGAPNAAGTSSPGTAATRSDRTGQAAQSGWFSGPKGSIAAASVAAADAEGNPGGVAPPQTTAAQPAKPNAGSYHPGAPADRASAEKTNAPDGGAAKADGQSQGAVPASQGAIASLLEAGSSVRRQTTTRSESAEASLVARASDGRSGDPVRIAGRETAQPVQQVAIHIVRAAQSGQSVLRINLHPKELGQVDVTMEMRDGRLHVTIAADRTDTLQQLQQSARALERALQDAGLDIGQSGVHFASRDGQSRSAEQQAGTSDPFSAAGPTGAGDDGTGARVTSRYIEGVLDISL